MIYDIVRALNNEISKPVAKKSKPRNHNFNLEVSDKNSYFNIVRKDSSRKSIDFYCGNVNEMFIGDFIFFASKGKVYRYKITRLTYVSDTGEKHNYRGQAVFSQPR